MKIDNARCLPWNYLYLHLNPHHCQHFITIPSLDVFTLNKLIKVKNNYIENKKSLISFCFLCFFIRLTATTQRRWFTFYYWRERDEDLPLRTSLRWCELLAQGALPANWRRIRREKGSTLVEWTAVRHSILAKSVMDRLWHHEDSPGINIFKKNHNQYSSYIQIVWQL